MLSIGKLLPGRAEYYLGTVANGVEDYYTGAGEAPGQWIGRSADRLGLSGEVDADQLHRVLDFKDPTTGERLTRGHAVPRVVGFDTTFCAPKSVSLLFGLGDPEVSNAVRNAHDAAVARALEIYETITQGRRGAGGHQIVEGEGFVGAAFRHRTSRNLDPHLHTHVVVANLVHAAEDDRRSALDGRPLYQWCRTIGHLYNAELRHELTRRLGVEWHPVEDGLADITGIPRPIIDAFSTRSAEIEADLAEHGLSGAKAAQDAVYFTRSAKTYDVSPAGLITRWRNEAEALGFDTDALADTFGRARPRPVPLAGSIEADDLFARIAGPEGLTALSSMFGRRDVIEAICDSLPAGGRIDDILELADAFLVSDQIVALGEHGDAPLHRRNGHLVPSGQDVDRYSTPEMIAVEQRLLASAARRQDDRAGIADPVAVGQALDARPTITDEQAAMVRRVCSSGAGVDLVEGVAGSGKTFALAAANEGWTASGFTVSGACLAAKTARRLQNDAGIPATTLDALLLRLERERLGPTDVVVVDEAAMVGTRKLERLLAHAEAGSAKVVLIGDPCQLPEIEAGGAFVGLTRRLGAVELTDNRRQHEAWERAALGQLRNGDSDRGIEAFLDHDRIHLADQPRDLHRQLVDDWWTAFDNREHVLMCAATRRQVDELNHLARLRMADAEMLLGNGHWIGDRHYAIGDTVLALRNDYSVGLLNGDDGCVTGIDRERQELTVVNELGPMRIPFAYAEQWLTHGYATTIHKAQGATVDRTFVLADDTVSRPHLYTALSRGRVSNDLYATVSDWRDEIRHAPEHETDPLDGVRNAARRDASQELAVESDASLIPTDVLRAEHTHLLNVLAGGPQDRTYDLKQITAEIHGLRRSIADATSRRDDAAAQLEDMGPVGRRIHRKDRTRLEDQIVRTDSFIDATTARIAERSAVATTYSTELNRRRAWEAQHEPTRARLSALEQLTRDQAVVNSDRTAAAERHVEVFGIGD